MAWQTVTETDDRPPMRMFLRSDLDQEVSHRERKPPHPRSTQRVRRDIDIVMRAARGETRSDIAAAHNLSIVRVRQILRAAED